MFYKLIDENTIKSAPNPLSINGKDVFTNSEEILNKQGYFKLKITDYPQDGNVYEPKYILEDNNILQYWLKIDEAGEMLE